MPEPSTAQEHHEPASNKHTVENSAQTDVVVAVSCFICSSKFEALQKEVLHLKHKEAKLLSDNAVLLRSMEIRPVTTCSSDQLTESSVQFYTGLPSLALFALIVQLMQEGTKYLPSTVSLGDAVLMVLAKFRLALLNRDLAFRFNVSEGTVAHIMVNLIPLLATIFSKFIIWPTRPDIARTMPTLVHRHYPRCRIIVDCSECRIQRPLSFTARSQTYSHYKGTNTIKFLIGVTPCGAVSFISKAWAGRVSDKKLTQKSGLLDKLESGDTVLADRGFLIREDIGRVGATLVVPAFTRGKRQLPAQEVETARQMSKIRIHVERAIGRIKVFRILQDRLPITLLRHATNILLICSGITNLKRKLL
ncbi:unnamed protein product [Ixodes hexagonus]